MGEAQPAKPPTTPPPLPIETDPQKRGGYADVFVTDTWAEKHLG